MQCFGRTYPSIGYGARFFAWLFQEDPKPMGSWGNGSAMRASFAGWMARSLEEAEALGRVTAMPTHDHPEGILGAEKGAGCIRLLRDGTHATACRFWVVYFCLIHNYLSLNGYLGLPLVTRHWADEVCGLLTSTGVTMARAL